MRHAKLIGLGIVASTTMLTGGCAQVTVTANTLVDGTARIADATTNAVAGTSDFTTDTTRSADARTHQARLAFVDSELEMLRRETAAGQGEHLQALAYMMQAQNTAEFARLMQGHYAKVFVADATPAQVLERMYDVAGTPPDMRKG